MTEQASDNQGLVPKLRFPEFAEHPLHDVRLGDVSQECKARNKGKFAADLVMGVSKEEGIVPMQARLVADDISRYKILRKDWFAYNPMRLNIGSIGRWQGDSEVLVSPDYVVFRCEERDEGPTLRADYLDHFRRSTHWSAFTGEAGDGGVRVRIYYDDIAKVRLILPDNAEQQKIAACLSSLDALIAAETDKLAALRDHKKGLMQQLLPAEGETTPRLRFPEFRGAGEWSATELGSIADVKLGKMLDQKRAKQGKSYPYLNNLAVRWNYVDTTNLPEMGFEPHELDRFGLMTGDVLVCEGGEPGRAAVWNGKLAAVKFQKALHRVRFHSSFEPELFVTYLEAIASSNSFKSILTGEGIKHLTRENFLKLSVPIIGCEERKKIHSTFASLNKLIREAAAKLDTLQAHKLGIVQQLFPSSAEAAA